MKIVLDWENGLKDQRIGCKTKVMEALRLLEKPYNRNPKLGTFKSSSDLNFPLVFVAMYTEFKT